MKIAHVLKPWLPVPSLAYGAIEKMLAELIAEQSKVDNILLFAVGGSISSERVKLISLYPEGQGDKGLDRNTELAQAVHCALKLQSKDAKIIHAHSIDPFLGLAPFLKIPSIFTFYSNPTPAVKILSELAGNHTHFTFLSKSHRKSFPWIKEAGVIHFGLDPNHFPFSEKKKDYLAFVGTIADKKGIIEAIEIARRAKMRLKIAAKIRSEDKEFYENHAKKVIEDSNHVDFLGELNNSARNNLLKNARAMLFPIKWEEPLGLVMLESLVVGTPVIAFNRGSVPEIIEDGKTGFIVENIDLAVRTVERVDHLKPVDCRSSIASKFHIANTAVEFKKLYQRVLSR
ncbi:glycosyltransferase family 4 protein [Candidatus Shapirobacteria bacterium]|nr:glycosyltransferase family 4 protein [Candidatus Shapirobacteria bacterium]